MTVGFSIFLLGMYLLFAGSMHTQNYWPAKKQGLIYKTKTTLVLPQIFPSLGCFSFFFFFNFLGQKVIHGQISFLTTSKPLILFLNSKGDYKKIILDIIIIIF